MAASVGATEFTSTTAATSVIRPMLVARPTRREADRQAHGDDRAERHEQHDHRDERGR